MGHMAVFAVCALNQWSMDFQGNLARVLASIARARAAGATYRLGPELELCGYGCQDHFLESDTYLHAWQALVAVLQATRDDAMLVDVGLPVHPTSATTAAPSAAAYPASGPRCRSRRAATTARRAGSPAAAPCTVQPHYLPRPCRRRRAAHGALRRRRRHRRHVRRHGDVRGLHPDAPHPRP